MRLPQEGREGNDGKGMASKRVPANFRISALAADRRLLQNPTRRGEPRDRLLISKEPFMNLGQVEANDAPNLLEAFRRAHREIVNTLYDQGVADSGRPLEFRLFDREICSELDLSWLIAEVKDNGISAEHVGEMVRSGTIPKWSDSKGNEGFLLYTPEQVKVARELGDTKRYGAAEIKHMVQKWNEQIECTVEVIPYDELGGVDFEIYRRHVEREIEELQRHKGLLEKCGADADASFRQLEEQLTGWEGIATWLNSYAGIELPDKVRDRVTRRLFELRWLNEFVRISDAAAFRSRILQGFSPEVFFSSYESGWDTFKGIKIDWHVTLSEVQRSRAVGRQFPMRAPDFDLTEEGLKLRTAVTPVQYEELYRKYELEDLQREVASLGNELWEPSALAANTAFCSQCGARFPRTVPTRQYCSEACRTRARQQRWRDRDPERARQAVARYWANTYPD
jgi:hypothetical protein